MDFIFVFLNQTMCFVNFAPERFFGRLDFLLAYIPLNALNASVVVEATVHG